MRAKIFVRRTDYSAKKNLCVEVLWLYVGVVFVSVVFVVVFLVDSLFFSSLFKIESGAKSKKVSTNSVEKPLEKCWTFLEKKMILIEFSGHFIRFSFFFKKNTIFEKNPKSKSDEI